MWLHWKIKHGLAQRGRLHGPLAPRGFIAHVLYFLYFKRAHRKALEREKLNSSRRGPKVFHQKVGGSVGPAGRLNGD